MNKQEVVELMATYVQKENLEKVVNLGDKQRASIVSSEKMKDSFRVTCSNLYDVMDEQGLIVKD